VLLTRRPYVMDTGFQPFAALRRTALSPVPGARDPKLAERVAASIEAEILAADWPVGSSIGSEDDLMRSLGVGRSVLREAFRLLEHRHVAMVRRGRAGGLVVAEPTAQAVIESLAIYLDFAQVDLGDLFEARQVLEEHAAAKAAEGVDEDDLARLRDLAGPHGRDSASGPGSLAFRVHNAVAEATGNEALSVFVRTLVVLSGLGLERAASVDGVSARLAKESRRGHATLLAAVIECDPLAARACMAEHLAYLRSLTPDVAVPSYFARLQELSAHRGDANGVGRRRPGEALAGRVLTDIRMMGWPVGERLGFEADLLSQYGVGRAQFREALRVLESHSVVRTHRGVTGGVVVAAPDGRGLVRAATSYLNYKKVSVPGLRDLREELEVATMRLAMARMGSAGRALLASALARERDWPDDDFPAVSHDLHAIMADLSQNRTLALLLSVLMQLTAERLRAANQQQDPSNAHATRVAHRAVVEAMLAGDLPLASRRMRRHLRALSNWTLPTSERAGRHFTSADH
jgi:DNA-binding FadR family transcriptional regulator